MLRVYATPGTTRTLVASGCRVEGVHVRSAPNKKCLVCIWSSRKERRVRVRKDELENIERRRTPSRMSSTLVLHALTAPVSPFSLTSSVSAAKFQFSTFPKRVRIVTGRSRVMSVEQQRHLLQHGRFRSRGKVESVKGGERG